MIAAAAMQPVANHPSTRSRSEATNWPISSFRETTIIIAAISGTEITPLRTALQNSARIGSSGE